MREGKPSKTARKVALNIVVLGMKAGVAEQLPPGLVDSTVELLAASGAAGRKLLEWTCSPRMLRVYEAFDWMMPGQFEALGTRKVFCERQVRGAIADGATQVLVLGAGYDTLGWRLAPEFPDVRFVEIDHPATAALKADGIAAMGGRENLTLIPADLGERRLVDVLTANEEWTPADQAAIVAEGLVMYLPGDAVHDMFRQCAAVSGPRSRIAFSYVPTGADGRPDAGPWTGLALWLLRAAGEPWLWSIRPDEIGSFIERTGWTLDLTPDASPPRQGVEFFAAAVKRPVAVS